MPLSAHEAIIKLGVALGYQLTDIEKGLCHGISVSWMKADLLHQQDKFITRIERIINENDTLVRQIQATKERLISGEGENEEDRALLEIMALYDSIALHQAPNDFSETFNHHYHQHDIEHISLFSQSEQLEAEGGLQPIYSQAVIFSKEEMFTYFEKLAETLTAIVPPLTEPLSFILGSGSHSISLNYDVGKKTWTFMDINQWPPRRIHDPAVLTNMICQSSGYLCERDKTMSSFCIQMFAKKSPETYIPVAEALALIKSRHPK